MIGKRTRRKSSEFPLSHIGSVASTTCEPQSDLPMTCGVVDKPSLIQATERIAVSWMKMLTKTSPGWES